MGRLDWGFPPKLQPANSRSSSSCGLEAPRRHSARSAIASFRKDVTVHIRAQPNRLKRRIPFHRNARTQFSGRGACGSGHRYFSRTHDSRFIVAPFHPKDPSSVPPFGLVHGRTIPLGAHPPDHELLPISARQAHLRAWATPRGPRLQPARTRLRCRVLHRACTASCTATAPLLAALPTRLSRAQRTVPLYRQPSIRHRSTRTRRSIR